MKIYEIGTGYTPIPAKMGAATEIVVEELTKAMLKQGADVEIIDIQAADRLPNQLPITEVKVPRIFAGTDVQLGIMHKLKRVVYSVCLARKLAGILKKTDEKIVLHFHNQYNMFFYLKLVSKKLQGKAMTAYTNHSGIWSLPWDECKEVIRKRYFQEEESMKKADVVFALNQRTIENVVEYLKVPVKRLRLIAHGVNSEIYRPLSDEEKAKIKIDLELTEKKVILQVGSVYENKGQLRVLEMLTPLLKENDNLAFAYAGGIVSEDYQEQIGQYCKHHGLEQRVRYLGMVKPGEELNKVYNLAEATIVASGYEAFGLVYLESLAAGVPVLAEENTCFAAERGCIPYSKGKLCEAVIEQVLNPDAQSSHSFNARENAVENFSWSSIVQEHLQEWNK